MIISGPSYVIKYSLMEDARSLFSLGLKLSFRGDTEIEKYSIDGTTYTRSRTVGEDGAYIDQWTTGGGQEIIHLPSGEGFIRSYVGDTNPEAIARLNITEAEILAFLKEIVINHSELIRWDEDFSAIYGDWNYTYKVTYTNPTPLIINGVEEIKYRGQSVFIHLFGISKLRKEA